MALDTLKNLDHAVESLRNIIRAKGADYVYKKPVSLIGATCRYTLPVEGFGTNSDEYEPEVLQPPKEQIVGSCVMGALIIAEDPDAAPILFEADESGGSSITDALYSLFGWDYLADYEGSDYHPTEQRMAQELFAIMQREQDQGASWGVAFHRAIVDLNRAYGTNYNPDVNSVHLYKED